MKKSRNEAAREKLASLKTNKKQRRCRDSRMPRRGWNNSRENHKVFCLEMFTRFVLKRNLISLLIYVFGLVYASRCLSRAMDAF
jgi:hypothetical protein